MVIRCCSEHLNGWWAQLWQNGCILDTPTCTPRWRRVCCNRSLAGTQVIFRALMPHLGAGAEPLVIETAAIMALSCGTGRPWLCLCGSHPWQGVQTHLHLGPIVSMQQVLHAPGGRLIGQPLKEGPTVVVTEPAFGWKSLGSRA